MYNIGTGDVPPGTVSMFSRFWYKDGLHFPDFGIRNGVDFHDFSQRTVSIFTRMENRYMVGYTLSKNWYKVGYVFYAWAARPLQNLIKSPRGD